MPAPARTFYDDADVRAIRFNRARAESLGAALVLLAHRSEYDMRGNGPRKLEEHWIWYVGDPDHPSCEIAARPRVLLDRTIEAFGLKRCRIYRGSDTLRFEEGRWQLHPPRGWPATGYDPWREAGAELPRLQRGDIIEIAYAVENHWSRTLYPSDWVVAPLLAVGAPTLERHIVVSHNPVINGRVKLVGDQTKLIRHYGGAKPTVELLTGNLPPGPADPTSLEAPRFLFTTHDDWSTVRKVLRRHFRSVIFAGERMFKAAGDSIGRAHRPSRERLQAVVRYIERRCQRIPRSITSSTYYPRMLLASYAQGATDPLERALSIAALASAATMKVEIFLGRDGAEGFVSDFPIPMQFDRVILRVLLADEDRHLLLDPWAPDIEEGARAGGGEMLLIGVEEEWPGIYGIGENGDLLPAQID